MRFFFDRSSPLKIARMVAAISSPEHTIIHLDDDKRFTPTTADVDWLKTLHDDGPPAWIVVSGDGDILRNKVERQVLDDPGLRYFCLSKGWPNMPMKTYAWRFMKVWYDIIEAAKSPKGRIFQVQAGSAMKIDILD
jgi:hypothetical protein